MLFILLFGLNGLFSQTDGYEAAIEERFTAYGSFTESGEHDKLLDYFYPGLFKIMPRELLLAQLNEMANHPDLQLYSSNFHLRNIGEPIEDEGNTYTRVDFSYQLLVGFKPDAAGDQDFIDATFEALSIKHGQQRVKYDPANQTIKVRVHKRLLAIYPESQLEWYFLEYEGQQATLWENLIPSHIRRQL